VPDGLTETEILEIISGKVLRHANRPAALGAPLPAEEITTFPAQWTSTLG
jgi:hypothetical protein